MKALSTCALRIAIFLVLLTLVGSLSILLIVPERVKDFAQSAIDSLDQPVSDDGTAVIFRVEQGEGASSIGRRLEERGLIRSANLFRFMVSYYGVSTRLEAGEYELRANMALSEVISTIHKGRVKLTTFTIPEGWRLTQIADTAAKKGVFGREDLLKAAREGSFGYDFLPTSKDSNALEGYLFPDTYRIPPSYSASDFIKFMLSNFDQRVTPAMRQKATANGLSLHDTITLASIVEREAVIASERPLIAGVFLNRLKIGMPLQADPTVQYALSNDPGNVAKFGFWKIGITQADLDIVSPYNTYRNKGLPPGPICNPGLSSIQAVAEPTKSDYLYFVAKDDGSHAFAKTLEEHNQNIFRYRR